MTDYKTIHPETRAYWFKKYDIDMVRKNLHGFAGEGGDRPAEGVTICLTGLYDEKYDQIAEIAEANWLQYAQKHNYALRTYPGHFHTDPERSETYGDKARFSVYYDLRGLFNIVVLLDMDSLFINMDATIEDAMMGLPFVWTHGPGGPMSGLLMAKTDPQTEAHLRYAYEYAARENNVRHGVIEPNGISDQDAMTRLMDVPPFSSTFSSCVPAESIGFCFPDTKATKPWIITCKGGSIEEKLAVMQQVALGQAAASFIGIDGLPKLVPRPDGTQHKVEAYNPKFSFDRNWVGPTELRPRVYRTQSEKDTYYSVCVENEYNLPALHPDDAVIDIGAHIGSFSHRAYLNGSRSIYAFEIDPWHMEAASVNLGDFTSGPDKGIGLYHAAVVRGDDKRASEYHYDGAWNSFGQLGPTVGSFSLDEILDQVGEEVRFLKIDVEGAEYPVLLTCKNLNRVKEIAGEYHVLPADVPELQGLPYPPTIEGLKDGLEMKGFAVTVTPSNDSTGHFRAVRIGKIKVVPAPQHFFGKVS